MQTTRLGTVPPYLGIDLTDRYSAECRDIDVCGLEPLGNGRFAASFWHWKWDRAPHTLDIRLLRPELRTARLIMIDGPQGLAAKGSKLRICERQSAAVGKTPDTPPALDKPFAGFIRSSLDFFQELGREGIAISPANLAGGAWEVYPGPIWMLLAGAPLPRKSTDAGRLARKRMMEALGVDGLPSLPTHDQNDACVAAFLGAVVGGQVPGLRAIHIGAPLALDSDGTLREGPMVVPVITAPAASAIAAALLLSPPECAAPTRETLGTGVLPSAEELLTYFIGKAAAGDAQVCTYGWAYRRLFNTTYTKYSMAYGNKAIDAAAQTRPRELPGLGLVRLDTFIVNKRDRVPGGGYWSIACHDEEDWTRVLGNATVLD
jgi:hypothetical protein